MWIEKNRSWIIGIFCVLALASLALLPRLKFAFDFEQFFPDGDPDLEFYREFIKEFESDDNYLIVALVRDSSIFDTRFLRDVKTLTEGLGELALIENALSLPTLMRPVISPLGLSFVPVIDVNKNKLNADDLQKVIGKRGVFGRFISKDQTSTTILLKTKDQIDILESRRLMQELHVLLEGQSLSKYHVLGRAYFQDELSRLQFTEILYSSVASIILVTLILFIIYRNRFLIGITIISITLGLLLFLGVLALLGRELNAMAALYPVLMLIVGTSDVIHILSKYLDELRKGNSIPNALDTAIRQIGLATFFTSATTAIGFLSLITSRIGPVRGFGVNAAVGVIIAYITIILFTTALLTYFSPEKLRSHARNYIFWDRLSLWFYGVTKNHRSVYWVSGIILITSLYGITLISTDYTIESTLPRDKKITEDFLFFEKMYSGYRPLEYAVFKKDSSSILDYESIRFLSAFEKRLTADPSVDQSTSIVDVYELVAANFPQKEEEPDREFFQRIYPAFIAAINFSPDILVNKDRTKTRISGQINDIGVEKVKAFSDGMNDWVVQNIDTSIYVVKYTGTGVVLDKNALYVRESLLKGLAFALIIIGLLMGLLFRNIKMVLVSLIPNALPLIIAGAILGYTGIPLEPLTSITFAVIFGIAVDDTIHFLSKYRLAQLSGMDIEEALKISFMETGKAIIFTSVILFFGFAIMLFSYNPPSVIVGGLISLTLFTAVFADLVLLPVLLRSWHIK